MGSEANFGLQSTTYFSPISRMRGQANPRSSQLAVLKHITMNLIRLDTVPRKGGIKVRRLIAATSDDYRVHLFGLA